MMMMMMMVPIQPTASWLMLIASVLETNLKGGDIITIP
jgi:hypothetical protein